MARNKCWKKKKKKKKKENAFSQALSEKWEEIFIRSKGVAGGIESGSMPEMKQAATVKARTGHCAGTVSHRGVMKQMCNQSVLVNERELRRNLNM